MIHQKKVWGNDEDMIDDIPKEDKKADGKSSMGMKDIDIRDRNIGMSSNDEGGLDLSLDQDGWSWSGDETDLIDYINRVATSSKSDEFLEQLKDVPFDKLKEQMVKNIDDNPDAFYSLSGDSRRWKFGETEDGDMSYMIDEEITQAEEELTDEQIQKVSDDVWDNYDGGSYEEFMESWHGKELKGQFTKALEESDSLEELFEQFTQDTGLRYDSIVAQSGYDDDLKYNAIRETIQNVLGKKDSGESKTKSCGCKTKGLEASISKYEKFIKTEINVLKTRAKAGEAVGLMYGLPTVRKNGKKIKGTLAYAGVSLKRQNLSSRRTCKRSRQDTSIIVKPFINGRCRRRNGQT